MGAPILPGRIWKPLAMPVCLSGMDTGRHDFALAFVAPRMEREEVERSYRHVLVGAAMAAVAMPRLYDKYNPGRVVTLNGTFFLNRVAVEIARARDIRVILHERGWMDNTVGFITSGVAGDMAGYQERWAAWRDVPLTRAELQGSPICFNSGGGA